MRVRLTDVWGAPAPAPYDVVLGAAGAERFAVDAQCASESPAVLAQGSTEVALFVPTPETGRLTLGAKHVDFLSRTTDLDVIGGGGGGGGGGTVSDAGSGGNGGGVHASP